VIARASLLVFVLAAGCGTAGPPRGPAYDPMNPPEAQSQCPDKAKEAKTARENALGADEPGARRDAAKAIFEHAECERVVFDSLKIEGVSPDDFKASVARTKTQFYTVQNLYLEVVNYELPELSVAAYARAGDLYEAYAGKLRTSDPGPEVGDGAGRASWLAEIEQIALPVENDAVDLWGKALDVVMIGPPQFAEEQGVAPFVKAACNGLQKHAADRLDGYPNCR
jgi:hypothetical protein